MRPLLGAPKRTRAQKMIVLRTYSCFLLLQRRPKEQVENWAHRGPISIVRIIRAATTTTQCAKHARKMVSFKPNRMAFITLFAGFCTLGYLPALHELSLWLPFRFKMLTWSKIALRCFLQMCDVTEPELFTDQAEFNIVLERWFGELAYKRRCA